MKIKSYLKQRKLDQEINQAVSSNGRPTILLVIWAAVSVFAGLVVTNIVTIAAALVSSTDEIPEVSSVSFQIGSSIVMWLLVYFGIKRMPGVYNTLKFYGVKKPVLSGIILGVVGYIVNFLLEILINFVFSGGDTEVLAQSDNNLNLKPSLSIAILSILGFCILVPMIEEFIFRGVMLRILMARYGYWVAAVVSSLVFAAFHLSEVRTLGGAIVLGVNMFVMAMIVAWFNRITGSLVPGMVLHILNNSVAIIPGLF